MWVRHKRKTKKYVKNMSLVFAFLRFIFSDLKIDPAFIFGFNFKGGGDRGRNGDDQAFSYAQLQ